MKDYEPPKDKWGKDQGDILRELLKEKGIAEFTSFQASAEGQDMPTGLEEMSFQIITKNGKVYDCSISWNEKKNAPDDSKGYYYLDIFKEYTPEKRIRNSSDFLEAKKELGLK